MWEETPYIYLHAIHIPVYLRMQFAFRTLKFPPMLKSGVGLCFHFLCLLFTVN
jgi:hypothetical protein